MNTIRGLYREGGIKAVIVRSAKKLMSPVVSVGNSKIASLKVESFPTQVGEQTICQYNYI